jgi:hypothetical protein
MKISKTWKFIFTSTRVYMSIIDLLIMSSMMYALFESRSQTSNELICTTFTTFHSTFMRYVVYWRLLKSSKIVWTMTKSIFFWEISICIIRCKTTRQDQFNMMQRISFWISFNKFNFDSFYSQTSLFEKRVIFKTRLIWCSWRRNYNKISFIAWLNSKWIKAQITFRYSRDWC